MNTMEYYSIKKDEILPICNNMDGPREYYAKWNMSHRDRQIPYDLTYMWKLKKQMDKQSKTKTES